MYVSPTSGPMSSLLTGPECSALAAASPVPGQPPSSVLPVICRDQLLQTNSHEENLVSEQRAAGLAPLSHLAVQLDLLLHSLPEAGAKVAVGCVDLFVTSVV